MPESARYVLGNAQDDALTWVRVGPGLATQLIMLSYIISMIISMSVP